MLTVKDIREHFISELKDEAFTTDKTGQQTIEMLYNGKDFNALIYVVISIVSCLMGTYLAYSLFKTS